VVGLTLRREAHPATSAHQPIQILTKSTNGKRGTGGPAAGTKLPPGNGSLLEMDPTGPGAAAARVTVVTANTAAFGRVTGLTRLDWSN
jgi:hypothetical protein